MKKILLTIALSGTTCLALASGVDDGTRPYIPQNAPRQSYAQYFRGTLGVFSSDYARRYLVAAYRQMSAKPLGVEEIAAFTPPDKSESEVEYDAISAWQTARNLITGQTVDYPQSTASYEEMRSLSNGTQQAFTVFYSNCLPDAYRTATKTLQRYRANASAELLDAWVKAQNQVFSNCTKPSEIPSELPPGQPEFARQDRVYQIASAYFYAGRFEQAEHAFLAIASDAKSPWAGSGLYLAGRSALRLADLSSDPDRVAQAKARARQYLNDVQRDRNLAPLHASAKGLLRLIATREYDKQRLNVRLQLLAHKLANTGNVEPAREISEDLREMEMLMDQAFDDSAMPGKTASLDMKTDPMLDWIGIFQCANPDRKSARGAMPACLDYAMKKWRSEHDLPWAVAVIELLHADRSAPRAIPDDIAGFVQTIKPAHPAYAFVQFHLVFDAYIAMARTNVADPAREMAEEKVRNELDRLLGFGMDVYPFDSRFLLQNMRVTLARDLPDLKNNAFYLAPKDPYYARQEIVLPAWSAFDIGLSIDNLWQFSQLFDGADEIVRSSFENAAVTRALALGRHQQAKDMLRAISARHPEILQWLTPYLNAATPAALYNESMMLLASQSEMVFAANSNFRAWKNIIGAPSETIGSNSWWWTDRLSRGRYGAPSQSNSSRIPLSSEAVMLHSAARFTGNDGSALAAQIAGLQKLGEPTAYLGRFVLGYVKNHSEDPRLPYVMSLLIASTRSGVEDRTLSRALFIALHKHYPDSRWAQQTQYYY